MTCREFEHRATSLTLWELSRAQDQQILGHASECQKCAGWLRQQRMLAATMQALQARTAGCAPGADVERALVRAFRQRLSQPVRLEVEHRITPVVLRLSRFFEVGAYVATAAAIVVALLLGVRLWEQRSVNLPAQSQKVQPSASVPSVAVDKSESDQHQQRPAVARNGVDQPRPRHVRSANRSRPERAEPSQTSMEAGYVALMFCDPLSCSSDAQVVRMELPSPAMASSGGEQDAQMRIADVVVGYDGVVRAVRIVN